MHGPLGARAGTLFTNCSRKITAFLFGPVPFCYNRRMDGGYPPW